MGALQRFEKRLGRLVEGSFAKVFRGEPVQPVEVAAGLQRECDDRAAVVGPDRSLVPNHFVVELGPRDHERLAPYQGPLCDELAAMVREHAADQGYVFVGPVAVHLEVHDDVEFGTFRIRSEATAEGEEPAVEEAGPGAWYEAPASVAPPAAASAAAAFPEPPATPPAPPPPPPPPAPPLRPPAEPAVRQEAWYPEDDEEPLVRILGPDEPVPPRTQRVQPPPSVPQPSTAWRSSPYESVFEPPAASPPADAPPAAAPPPPASPPVPPSPAAGGHGVAIPRVPPPPAPAPAPPAFGSNMTVLPPSAPAPAPPAAPAPSAARAAPAPPPPPAARPGARPASAAPVSYRHRLVLTGGTAAMRGAASRGSALALPVTRAVTVIGRGSDVDLRLDDPGVSRQHAELHLDPVTDRVEVVDLNSTNGLIVNGQRVRRATLVEGDRIQLGHTVLVYRRADG